MTNQEIITRQRIALVEAGIIGANEQIHTFADWKNSGYIVKKGQHAIAKFTIWKYSDKPNKAQIEARKAAGADEDAPSPRYYMTNAAFFSSSQVEKIEKAPEESKSFIIDAAYIENLTA